MLSTANPQLRFGATFAARISSGIGGSVLSFLIARECGPSVLGQFTTFISVLGIASIVAPRGLNSILIRGVAEEKSLNPGADTRGLFFTAVKMCIIPIAALSLLGAFLLNEEFLGRAIQGSEAVFMIALPLLTLLTLASAYLKGLGKPWISPLFEIGGVSGIASIFLVLLAIGEPVVSGPQILITFLAGLTATCAFAWFALRPDFRPLPSPLEGSAATASAATRWTGQYDFMIIALSAFVLQAGSFAVVSGLLPSHDLGLLRAAERLAVIISFPILAINPFIASEIVKFRVTSEPKELRRTVRRAMAVGAMIAIGPFLAFVLFPAACLSWIGPHFSVAAGYLQLMAFANFVIVLLGPSAMVVNMSRMERSGMIVSASFLALGLALFPLLTIIWGASGFVAAYCMVGMGRAIVIYVLARKAYRTPAEGTNR